MSSNRRGESWHPPPWHAPQPEEAGNPPSDSTQRSARTRGTSQPPTASDDLRPLVLGFALAPGVTGVLAVLMSIVGPVSRSRGLPYALVLLCIVQSLGYVATRRGGADALSRTWIVSLIATAGALPMLAIQSNLLHEPYVALSRHSATPAIGATLVVVIILAVSGLWCVGALWSAGGIAAIVYGPLALLVPSVFGMSATPTQRTALEALGASSLLAAGVAVIAWSVPHQVRPYLPFVALCGDIAALLIAGRGPHFPATSGAIVIVLYIVTLLTAAVSTLIMPMVAAWLARAVRTLDDAESPRR